MPDKGRQIINTARIYLLDSELLDSPNTRHLQRLEILHGNGIIQLVVYDHRGRKVTRAFSSIFGFQRNWK